MPCDLGAPIDHNHFLSQGLPGPPARLVRVWSSILSLTCPCWRHMVSLHPFHCPLFPSWPPDSSIDPIAPHWPQFSLLNHSLTIPLPPQVDMGVGAGEKVSGSVGGVKL